MQVIQDIEQAIQNLSLLAKAMKFSRFILRRIPARIDGIKVYPRKAI